MGLSKMITLEMGLSLAGGFVMGAGAVVFAAGKMVGSVTTAVESLTSAVDLLRTDILTLSARLHEVDVEQNVTRAKLESLNGCVDSEPTKP